MRTLRTPGQISTIDRNNSFAMGGLLTSIGDIALKVFLEPSIYKTLDIAWLLAIASCNIAPFFAWNKLFFLLDHFFFFFFFLQSVYLAIFCMELFSTSWSTFWFFFVIPIYLVIQVANFQMNLRRREPWFQQTVPRRAAVFFIARVHALGLFHAGMRQRRG